MSNPDTDCLANRIVAEQQSYRPLVTELEKDGKKVTVVERKRDFEIRNERGKVIKSGRTGDGPGAGAAASSASRATAGARPSTAAARPKPPFRPLALAVPPAPPAAAAGGSACASGRP